MFDIGLREILNDDRHKFVLALSRLEGRDLLGKIGLALPRKIRRFGDFREPIGAVADATNGFRLGAPRLCVARLGVGGEEKAEAGAKYKGSRRRPQIQPHMSSTQGLNKKGQLPRERESCPP